MIVCPACGAKNRIRDDAVGVPRRGKCHESLPWIVDADTAAFETIVATTSLTVVVDLWAPWCGPCAHPHNAVRDSIEGGIRATP